jgi:nitrate reductase gamma subunit
MLILLTSIASTGILMTFFHNHPNILLVKNFAQGLITLNWSELPAEGNFLAHILLVFVLMAIYPISKLLHAPGVFFSPTLNQVDNARKKRHIPSWNLDIEKNENGQDLDKNN